MVETLKNEVDNSERFQEDIGKELALKGWKEMQKAFNNAEQELNNADINANYPKLFEGALKKEDLNNPNIIKRTITAVENKDMIIKSEEDEESKENILSKNITTIIDKYGIDTFYNTLGIPKKIINTRFHTRGENTFHDALRTYFGNREGEREIDTRTIERGIRKQNEEIDKEIAYRDRLPKTAEIEKANSSNNIQQRQEYIRILKEIRPKYDIIKKLNDEYAPKA